MVHRVAPLAAIDLDEIWYYVAQESGGREIATRLIDSIARRFVLLSKQSYLGRARDDEFGVGARSFPVGEYVIVYCIEDENVLILRVAHGRRDIDALF
jgi:toxin ParE1/3/4